MSNLLTHSTVIKFDLGYDYENVLENLFSWKVGLILWFDAVIIVNRRVDEILYE